ncbi:MAG: hypothetical protein ACRELF_07330 [Gemmataceae bacterium]
MSDDRDITDNREGADDDGHQADLLALRRLSQSVLPPEPEEAAWHAVLARVHASVESQAATGRFSRPLWGIVGFTAAAAILALLLTRSLWRTSVPAPAPRAEEAFPVVEADDVIIVSMDARDVAALVVGEPPISGELAFARPEDIRVIRCERCPHSGRLARLEPGEEVPMFVSTAAVAPPDDDEPEN